MPIFSYRCSYCCHEFDEYFKSHKGTGTTLCIKCGNTSFKIPAIFNPKIFSKRKFSDGTETPDFVRTPSQEKAWMKSQGITYDAPSSNQKNKIKSERKEKSKTAMEIAFKKASDKFDQGYRIENIDKMKQREVKKDAMQFQG